MLRLETRVPPPLVGLTVALIMRLAAKHGPVLALPRGARLAAAGTLALLGFGSSVAGMLAFNRAKTTMTPLEPEKATALVTDGVYAYTRNPMYLGVTTELLAWAVYLASPWALLGPPAFALYIARFQIKPEERAMAKLFGAGYEDYKMRVRRWL